MKNKIKKISLLIFNIILILLVIKNEYLLRIFNGYLDKVYLYGIFIFLLIINSNINIFYKKKKYMLVFILVYLYLNLLCIKELNRLNTIFFTINIIFIWKNILNIIEEELKIKNIPLNIFLSIFGVYYLLKEKNIIRKYVNDGFDIKIILLVYFIYLLVINRKVIKLRYEKIIRKKKYSALIEFCQKILPFYLLKDGSIKIFPILLIGSIINILKNKKIKNKKLCIGILINILFIISSYILNGKSGLENKKDLLKIIEITVYLLVLLNLIWSKKIIQESIYVFLTSSLLTIYSVILSFSENSFKFIRYTDGFLIIPFGIKNSMLSLVIFFIIIKYYKYSLLPILSLTIFGVILSGSRSPFGILLLLFILLSYITYKKNKKQLLKIGILIFSIGVLIIYLNKGLKERILLALDGKDSSTLTRIEIYKESWRQFKNKPLIGNGIGNYSNVSKIENKNRKIESYDMRVALFEHQHSHNNILQILSRVGILSLGIYLYIQLLILKSIYKLEEFNLGLMVFLCYQLNGLTDTTILFFSIQRILFFILIIVMQNKKIVKE